MRYVPCHPALALSLLAGIAPFAQIAHAQVFPPFILPEEQSSYVRSPSELPRASIPDIPPPPTVTEPRVDTAVWQLSLDEAIRVALANSEVIRVLGGVAAVSSGRSIYDTAIVGTAVEEEQARFDPSAQVSNRWNRFESAAAVFDPLDPSRAQIVGARTDDYDLNLGLSKTTSTGGTVNFGVNTNPRRFQPGFFPLNPQARSSLDLSYTQPLLQGGGISVKRAPIVLARNNTERSYFQLKDGVQGLVSNVIAAYWSLVSARTDVWATERQLEQAQFAYDMTEAKLGPLSNAGDLAQTRVSLENFRSSLLASHQSVLERESALRSILGLDPYDGQLLVPVTPPDASRHQLDWRAMVELAEEHRPDLIELKLIIEADEQRLLLARNQSSPRVDAVALYRWNGLHGEMPSGVDLHSRPGRYTDWTFGIDFSVPLGLRRERAQLRRQELIIARDWANLEQGLQTAVHILGQSYRNLAHLYRQYEISKHRRNAARTNLSLQMESYRTGKTPFINVLLAINDWGNSISSEAQSLTQYNMELANLERETGTILETHGIRFYEERFASVGPLGRLAEMRCYPSAMRPAPNEDRYPSGTEPAENSFNLENPVERLDNQTQPHAQPLPPPVQLAPDMSFDARE